MNTYTVERNITHSKEFSGNQEKHQNFDPSILPYKFGLIFMGMKQKKVFEKKKKNPKWPTRRNWVFQFKFNWKISNSLEKSTHASMDAAGVLLTYFKGLRIVMVRCCYLCYGNIGCQVSKKGIHCVLDLTKKRQWALHAL